MQATSKSHFGHDWLSDRGTAFTISSTLAVRQDFNESKRYPAENGAVIMQIPGCVVSNSALATRCDFKAAIDTRVQPEQNPLLNISSALHHVKLGSNGVRENGSATAQESESHETRNGSDTQRGAFALSHCDGAASDGKILDLDVPEASFENRAASEGNKVPHTNGLTKPGPTERTLIAAGLKRILVTGGAGFIGANFVNYWTSTYPMDLIVNYDSVTSVSNLKNIQNKAHRNYFFVKGELGNSDLLKKTFDQYKFTHVVHLAAASNVDRSFICPTEFTNSNVYGTHVLLEAIRPYAALELFVHISTDEVYGEVCAGINSEADHFAPTNPYAASKAAAECLVMTYGKAYHIPYVITRANNVYGPYQYPLNVVPRFTSNLLSNQRLPVHGAGLSTRRFIHVLDKCRALDAIIRRGTAGEVYNIGTEDEISVRDLGTLLVKLVLGDTSDASKWLEFVQDRPYNDARYAIDCVKLSSLGWKATVPFDTGLKDTVAWYKANQLHWQP